jgi:hypothetical protein
LGAKYERRRRAAPHERYSDKVKAREALEVRERRSGAATRDKRVKLYFVGERGVRARLQRFSPARPRCAAAAASTSPECNPLVDMRRVLLDTR